MEDVNKQQEKKEQFCQIIDETELFDQLELFEVYQIDELDTGCVSTDISVCYSHKQITNLHLYPPVLPSYTEYDGKENAEKYRAIKYAQDFVIDVAKGVIDRPYYWDINLKQWILKQQ